MNRILLGALAGLAATGPMTLAMKLMHEQLPREERYPLPPRQVTEGLAEKAGVNEHLDEEERETHVAVSGKRLDGHPVLAGVGFGFAVWAASYLGWLPAAGIISPATEHPARRNALMIAAHVVWGATTGVAIERLSDSRAR